MDWIVVSEESTSSVRMMCLVWSDLVMSRHISPSWEKYMSVIYRSIRRCLLLLFCHWTYSTWRQQVYGGWYGDKPGDLSWISLKCHVSNLQWFSRLSTLSNGFLSCFICWEMRNDKYIFAERKEWFCYDLWVCSSSFDRDHNYRHILIVWWMFFGGTKFLCELWTLY